MGVVGKGYLFLYNVAMTVGWAFIGKTLIEHHQAKPGSFSDVSSKYRFAADRVTDPFRLSRSLPHRTTARASPTTCTTFS